MECYAETCLKVVWKWCNMGSTSRNYGIDNNNVIMILFSVMLTKIFETKQNESRVSFACLKTEICCLKAVFSPRMVHIWEFFFRIWGNLPAGKLSG